MQASGVYDARPYRMVVLGPSFVGKTSLISRSVTDTFNETYDSTIEDMFRKDIVLADGSMASLEILDTGGDTEEFGRMNAKWINDANAFVLVYDTTSLDSFHALEAIRATIVGIKRTKRVPMVLVGNKSDLEHKRELSINKGKRLAKTWGCPFFETSAKSSINNEAVFVTLAERLRRRRAYKEKWSCRVVDDEETDAIGSLKERSAEFVARLRRSVDSAKLALARRVRAA